MKKNEILVCGNVARDIILGDEYFGGSASVIATNLAKLGVPASILSVMGSDTFSANYLQLLKNEGVATKFITRPLRELPTCQVSSTENVSSARRWSDNGSRAAMTELDFSLVEFESSSKIIHLVGCPPELVTKFEGVSTPLSYDPGPRILQDSTYINGEIISKSKFMFTNDEEFIAVEAALNIDSPIGLMTHYPLEALVVTHGERGSMLYQRNGPRVEVFKIDSYPIAYVDPTGAGDAYRSGFLYGVTLGVSLEQACKYGSYLAALTVSQKGGIINDQNLNKFRKEIHGNSF